MMKVPTHKECFVLLEKYKTLPNIMDHSIIVNKVANWLAHRLHEKGIDIDLEVVDRASLLHDIGKSVTILEHLEDRHHILAEEILKKEGYPELGLVCRRHSLMEFHNLFSLEEKVVKYADIRVKHDRIVSVRERMADLKKRYNVPKGKMIAVSEVLKLEKEIFDMIGKSPTILKKVIK
jgi:uncharacterized protein